MVYISCPRTKQVARVDLSTAYVVEIDAFTPRLDGVPMNLITNGLFLFVLVETSSFAAGGVAVFSTSDLTRMLRFVPDPDVSGEAIVKTDDGTFAYIRKTGELVLRKMNAFADFVDAADTRFAPKFIIQDETDASRLWMLEPTSSRYAYAEASPTALALLATGTLTHAKGNKSGYARCTELVVASSERGRVQRFNIADVENPTLVSETTSAWHINHLLYIPIAATEYFLSTEEYEADTYLPTPVPRTRAVATDNGLIVLHGTIAAASYRPWASARGIQLTEQTVSPAPPPSDPISSSKHRVALSPDGTLCAIVYTNQIRRQVAGFPKNGVAVGGETLLPVASDSNFSVYEVDLVIDGTPYSAVDGHDPGASLVATEWRAEPDGSILLGTAMTAGWAWSIDAFDWIDLIVVYELVSGTWQQNQQIEVPNARLQDTRPSRMGAVSFTDDAQYVAVGHPGINEHGPDILGVDYGPTDKGAVDFYQITGATGSRTLSFVTRLVTPFKRREDFFGQSISITPDRGWMAAGAPGGDEFPGGNLSGSVYAIKLDDNFQPVYTKELIATDRFRGAAWLIGHSAVNISEDGTQIMAGSLEAWRKNGASLDPVTYTASPGQTVFTWPVALDVSFTAAQYAATRVTVDGVLQTDGVDYNRTTGPDGVTFVAPLAGGETVVVTPAYGPSNGVLSRDGDVHVFRSTDDWVTYTHHRIIPDDNAKYSFNDQAGEAAWMTRDALFLVIGAKNHDHEYAENTGAVYVYERCTPTSDFTLQAEIYGAAGEQFGRAVWASEDKDRIYIGRAVPNAIDVYHRAGTGDWVQVERIEEGTIANFGEHVSVSLDEQWVAAVGGGSGVPPTDFVLFAAAFKTRVDQPDYVP